MIGSRRTKSAYGLGARKLSAKQAEIVRDARSYARTHDGVKRKPGGGILWKTESGKFVPRSTFMNPKKYAKYEAEKREAASAMVGHAMSSSFRPGLGPKLIRHPGVRVVSHDGRMRKGLVRIAKSPALAGMADDEIQIEPDYYMTPIIDEWEAVVPNTTPLSWGNLGPNKPQVEEPASYAENLLKAWKVGGGAPVKAGDYTFVPTGPGAPTGMSTGTKLALAGVGLAALFFLKKRRS